MTVDGGAASDPGDEHEKQNGGDAETNNNNNSMMDISGHNNNNTNNNNNNKENSDDDDDDDDDDDSSVDMAVLEATAARAAGTYSIINRQRTSMAARNAAEAIAAIAAAGRQELPPKNDNDKAGSSTSGDDNGWNDDNDKNDTAAPDSAAATATAGTAATTDAAQKQPSPNHRLSVQSSASQYTAGTATSSSMNRYETFTEAVPLSLSSMAHASVPLEEGVLDGIKQILHHTLLSCVNYARIMHPPHQWTFRDLVTSPFAWEPHKSGGADTHNAHTSSNNSISSNNHHHMQHSHHAISRNFNQANSRIKDMPWALQKMQFKHEYTRNSFIYLQPALPADLTSEEELHLLYGTTPSPYTNNDTDGTSSTAAGTTNTTIPTSWHETLGILGRVSLKYLTTEPLTRGEMDGTDTDDMPPCILYKVEVQYRSLPPTGNKAAVQAEELSMLSFGGSVDDDVKYGALASLYDEDAKYVLEIYSVRGKKYKFDLMDSTLSDGTIPNLPSVNNRGGAAANANKQNREEVDPFAKSLCVTVTDHDNSITMKTPSSSSTAATDSHSSSAAAANNNHHHSAAAAAAANTQYAITRMHLLLEGKPRRGNNFDNVPAFDYIANAVVGAFLIFNPQPPQSVTGCPSGHALLLDPEYAGRIYVNGSYVTTWGEDPRIGSHGVALFGMDLHSIPFWNGRIVDYDALKIAYAQLWHEILVDARLMHLNIGARLLARLVTGKDPPEEEDDDDLYDDDEDMDEENQEKYKLHLDCLEAQIMSSTQFDPVGISPKALATRFTMVYGQNAFPCLTQEVEWVKWALPDRKPVVVPQRAIPVLRRGGYFNAQQTAEELWFTETRLPHQGKTGGGSSGREHNIVLAALQFLEAAGCADDIALEQIAVVSKPPVPAGCGSSSNNKNSSVIGKSNMVCRFSEAAQLFCVHETFFTDPAVVEEYRKLEQSTPQLSHEQEIQLRGYLLGLYLAKEHPNGRVLARYLLKSKPPS